jgi:DNA-binding MarR family transcriptional regulator
MSVSEVTVGRFVRALEEEGWLERRPDPDDSRARLLEVTEKTRDHLPAFIRVTNTVLDQAFAGVGRDELLRLAELLAEVRGRLDGR